MRSICSDGAKVGANFERRSGEKVTIALFLGGCVQVWGVSGILYVSPGCNHTNFEFSLFRCYRVSG